jgi:hypothetical protein
MPGFSLRIFLVDGTSDGLRIVTKFNWTGVVARVARTRFAEFSGRPEFQTTGVYILRATDTASGIDKIYVGEGDNIATRISAHESKKDWWDEVIAISKNKPALNKAEARFLESELLKRAALNGLVDLDNGNSPGPPDPAEADEADLRIFLEDVLGLLPALGVQSFEGAAQKQAAGAPATSSAPGAGALGMDLFLKVGTTDAKGYVASDGFVVRAGSIASAHKESMPAKFAELRTKLESSGFLAPNPSDSGTLLVNKDIKFKSPNQAATAMYGTTLSKGRWNWKDAEGTSLNDLEARLATATSEGAEGPEDELKDLEPPETGVDPEGLEGFSNGQEGHFPVAQ